MTEKLPRPDDLRSAASAQPDDLRSAAPAQPDEPAAVRPSAGRMALGVIAGMAVAWAANLFFIRFIGRMIFSDDALHDSAVAVFTLAVPGFCGGLVAGWIAPRSGLTVGVLAGSALAAMGAARPFWRTAIVSYHAAHSGLLHYLTHNPIVLLTFCALGGWLAGQFGTGRFTLADANPVRPDESD
jgi:hypothetical protein